MTKHRVLTTKRLTDELYKNADAAFELITEELTAIFPVEDPRTRQQVLKYAEGHRRNVVFTSTHSVDIVEDILHHDKKGLPQWNVFTLDGRTKTAVSRFLPAEAIAATAANAAELATKIIERKLKEVVFFCGNLRRPELPRMLGDAGIIVHEVEVYETFGTPRPITQDYEAVLFFSPSAVDSFFLSNKLDPAVVCFTLGNTTAQVLSGYTKNKVVISTGTSQEEMMETVYSYFKK
ncbi:MAG TPA: uroporphyrinogen-III synthase [Flavisolibacter sp.]|jgi:uroporphyrinogen-III synthase